MLPEVEIYSDTDTLIATTPLWEYAFRVGVAPSLSTPGLQALARGLKSNDPRILQAAVTAPRLGYSGVNAHRPVEGADVVAYAAWQGDGLTTIGACDAYSAHVFADADTRLGYPGASGDFWQWFDDTPRDEVLPDLLRVVTAILVEREGGAR